LTYRFNDWEHDAPFSRRRSGGPWCSSWVPRTANVVDLKQFGLDATLDTPTIMRTWYLDTSWIFELGVPQPNLDYLRFLYLGLLVI
jgi:hypothetical protein